MTTDKHQQRKEYKQKVKANKKYIKNKTINKELPTEASLPNDVCIRANDAWKIVANEDKRYELIKGVTFDVFKKQFLMIFGESGSGKTTLLSILSALDRPSEGVINILGINTPTLKNSQLTKLRNQYIGYIFQQYGLLKEVNVLENVLVTVDSKTQHRLFQLNRKQQKFEHHINHEQANIIKKIETYSLINNDYWWTNNSVDLDYYELDLPTIDFVEAKEIFHKEYMIQMDKIADEYKDQYRDYLFQDEYIYKILKKLEISRFLNSDVNNLSGGQQQRVSIARAIAKKPLILFADEPTGAVDAVTAKCILNLFLDLMNEFGTTIIMVTHNNNLINLSDRYLILDSGKIIKDELNVNKKSIDEINFD